MSKEFERALVKAKVQFMAKPDAMFMSTLCCYLRMYADETIPTACVNGKEMRLNPQFFLSMPVEQQMTLLAHETYHLVYEHLDRRGSRDPKRYNWAGDYRINLDLKAAGYVPIPNWLYDQKYEPFTTDQIYDMLENEPPPAGGDDFLDIDTSLPPEEVKEFIADAILQAATVARMSGEAGSIPKNVQLYLDGLLKPKLPLSALLKRFFTDLGKNDFTWQRPNKRHVVNGHYLPSQKSGELMHLAFAYDMSGSVSDADIKRYVSELVGVLRMMKPDRLTLIQFDTRIISVDVIRNVNEMMKIKLVGRGGTSIHPLMDWAVKNKPNALIVFSDGEYAHPQVKPKCPVLWMIHGHSRDRFTCDFGQIIRFDTREENA